MKKMLLLLVLCSTMQSDLPSKRDIEHYIKSDTENIAYWYDQILAGWKWRYPKEECLRRKELLDLLLDQKDREFEQDALLAWEERKAILAVAQGLIAIGQLSHTSH